LKAGYAKRGEHRYQGTFHAMFTKRGGDHASPEGSSRRSPQWHRSREK
jgi:hypothetical protein